jgi:hypothetical protein
LEKFETVKKQIETFVSVKKNIYNLKILKPVKNISSSLFIGKKSGMLEAASASLMPMPWKIKSEFLNMTCFQDLFKQVSRI